LGTILLNPLLSKSQKKILLSFLGTFQENVKFNFFLTGKNFNRNDKVALKTAADDISYNLLT